MKSSRGRRRRTDAMPVVRILSRLDIKGPNVVKGIHLEGLRVVGQPGEMARRYYDQGIDEIIYMDIVASLYGRNNILSVVEEAARDIFVPLTVGGGIRAIEDITTALRSGADKVAINTAAIAQPDFIDAASNTFGSQCIVLSVEAKRWPDRDGWEALTDNGREKTGADAVEWAAEAERRGAGEILVTSVDREGTTRGLDLELLDAIRRRVRVPVIASGGVGEPGHVTDAIDRGCVDAVACAHVFQYDICPIPDFKAAIAAAGAEVRPCAA